MITAFLLISFCLSVLFPIFLFYILNKKYTLPAKPLWVGALIWIIFSQILEKALHFVVLGQTGITHVAFLYVIYGGLAAGIFEETGRYIAFKRFLPDRAWQTGVSYGIGHGGIEAILIGGIATVETLLLHNALSSGALTKAHLSSSVIHSLANIFTAPTYLFLLTGIERVFTLFIQIALSVLVLYAIKRKKIGYFFLAIIFHTLIDIPAALFQINRLSLIPTETLLGISAIISIVFLFKSKALFQD